MVKHYEDFRDRIINVINDSGLDIGMVTYIMRDVYREAETAYQKQVSKEIEEASHLFDKLGELKEEDSKGEAEDDSAETVDEG